MSDRRERAAVIALLGAVIAVRVLYVFRLPYDSDEPQHLHVVWSWVAGRVPYRDLFDNHAPLFHLLLSPLAAAIGERPDLLDWLRLALCPVFAITLWATWQVGKALFSPRAGLWGAVALAAFPPFYRVSAEFRPDGLWTALWVGSIAIAVGGALTWRRSAAMGLLLGAAVATSVKSILLLAALAAAFGSAVVLSPASGGGSYETPAPRTKQGRSSAERLGRSMVAAAAFAAVPLAIAAFLHGLGALPRAVDDLVWHNAGAYVLWRDRLWRALAFSAALPVIRYAAAALARRSPSGPVAFRRVTVFVAAGVYVALLNGFAPLVNDQDFLPFYPLAAVLLAPLAVGFGKGKLLPAALVSLELAVLAADSRLWRPVDRRDTRVLADVLRLTDSTDLVMDAKGETVFRRRPVYPMFDAIALARYERGRTRDRVPEALIATRTYVAALDRGRFPPTTRRFLDERYLPVGYLRVAGAHLRGPRADGVLSFEIVIPGPYVIVSPRGLARGILDGSVCEGARFLSAGRHRFRPFAPGRAYAAVWARAAERGFSPFRLARETS